MSKTVWVKSRIQNKSLKLIRTKILYANIKSLLYQNMLYASLIFEDYWADPSFPQGRHELGAYYKLMLSAWDFLSSNMFYIQVRVSCTY